MHVVTNYFQHKLNLNDEYSEIQWIPFWKNYTYGYEHKYVNFRII